MRCLVCIALLGACSSDDGSKQPPLTHDTSLLCPQPAGLPFELVSWGWTGNESIQTDDPRNKDQATDTLGNPNGMQANVFVADSDSASSDPVSYQGLKARTTLTGGLFGNPVVDEAVSLWTYDGSAWSSKGRAQTGADGTYDFSSTGFVAENNKPVYSVLEADGSCAEHYNLLLPAGSKVVVSDIDGTLTTDDQQELDQIPDATYVPLMMGHANDMAQAWADKGYPVIYLTARPHLFRVETRVWLRDQMFPTGVLITGNNESDAATYKTIWLKRMIQTFGWNVVAAYGNAQTDVDAYNNVGIPKAQTFIVGPLGSDGMDIAIPNMDYGDHITSYIDQQPDNTP
ncbi:MAG: hypothetical protein QM831_33020 [Kofleriaceae bacterium]